MTTSPPLSGARQDTKSISSESSSSLNDLSCGTRKADVASVLDNETLCSINSKNLNSHNATEPHNVSVDFFTERPKRKGSSARRESEKRTRSTKTTYVIASIDRINSSSSSTKSKEELVQDRLRKRNASGNPEFSEKTQRVSESESGCSISYSDLHTSKPDFEGKYKQLGLIGKGGYGSVYAGLRLADSLPVAIKYADGWRAQRELKVVLMLKAGGGPESVGKFAAVSLLDWYCVDQKLVLVMERPPVSLDLAQYVDSRGGRLQEAEARALMKQLVDAAMEMYHKGVFHRDLKLENMLVEIGSPGPRLRIIDFGCGSYVQKNFSRYFHGTLPFAPPEWFKYEKYKPVSTTVWQLGAILYRMLHSYPFDTRLFTIGQIKFSINVSQECLDFLCVCLEEKPKKRATLEQLRAHAWLN